MKMNNVEKTQKLLKSLNAYRSQTESKVVKWVEGPMPYFAYDTEILFGVILYHQQILHKTHVVSLMMMDDYSIENGLKIYVERIGYANVEVNPKNENLNLMNDEERLEIYEQTFKEILEELMGLQKTGKLIATFPEHLMGEELITDTYKKKLKKRFYIFIIIVIILLFYFFY